MARQDWRKSFQRMARGERLIDALGLFEQRKDVIENEDSVDAVCGEKLGESLPSSPENSLFARDTQYIAQLVAKWSIYALPPDENVLGITVDVSQPDQAPLVTARTEGGEVFLFDVTEGPRVNADHKEACMHVEASWADWQDRPEFIPLFCEELTAALTMQGLPEPEYIR